MNTLPTATVDVDSGSLGGYGAGLDNIAVIGPSSAGPLLAPRVISSAKAEVETFGYGEPAEFVARYVRRVRKKVVRVRVPAATASVISRVNDDRVAGTSAVTLTGTPYRRYDFVWECVAGGTIGVDGITFRYSTNGGKTWSQTTRLGTAALFAIPKTGMTINFAAGTVLALDRLTALATAAEGTSADYLLALNALIEFNVPFRALVITGEFSASEATSLRAHIDTLYEGGFRPIVFFASRDWRPDAVMSGAPTLAFANANPDTITRNTGSFVDDGFAAGMSVTVAGSTGNNGTYTIASLTATVITLVTGDSLTVEAAAAGRTLTGEETETTWIASLLAEWGTWEDEKGRLVRADGRIWTVSEIDGLATRVPLWWPAVERWMQHDIQIAAHRKGDRELVGYSIYDPLGVEGVIEHDGRANDALLQARGCVARTFTSTPNHTFLALSPTMAPSGSAFGHWPWTAVSNLFSDIVQRVTEDFIGDDPEVKEDGTLTEEELSRYQEIVEDALRAELLSTKTEGARASSVSWEPSDTDVINVPNSTLNGSGTLRTNGLIGSIRTRVVVNPPE